jgi:tripartite-type tricarboxylate transporter receptor subunit TctC
LVVTIAAALIRVTLAIAVLALALPGAARAQPYPAKPVRIVVPFAAGGAVDQLARLVGAKVSEHLGQPMIVENRPGGGGNVAADAVAKSPPDGYTILQNTNGQAISPALHRALPFDVVNDFIAVTQLVASDLVLAASPRLAATSVRELIALAKAQPGSLNYGMSGIGNPLHLTMEMLKITAGIEIQPVPYRGDSAIFQALTTGEVQVAVVPLATSLPQIAAGTVRALAVAGAKRSPALPDVPTVAESGLDGFESSSWQGWFVPAHTSHEMIATLHAAVRNALSDHEVIERLRVIGYAPVASTPAEFDVKFRAELAKFAKIVREAHIPMED